ncbi:MAG: TRAP transporter large permease subunit, partial [Paracoccus sp. (in: a-proteobacteria)]
TVGFCVIVGVLSRWLFPLVASGMDEHGRPRTYAASILVEGFRIRDLPSVTMRSAQITGILAPLIGISVVMQQILSLLGAQEAIGQWVSGLGGYWVMLAASMAIIFVAGMVLESLPVTIILAPILAPLAAANGMDPVHFAVIFLVGASIGFVTPPYGLNLYVASSVTGVPYMRLLRYALYYLAALLSVWIIVAVTPSLATILLPSR